MLFSPEFRFRLKGAGLHLLVSALVACAAAAWVLLVWYPSAYRELAGGMGLLGLMLAIDIVLGPLVTLCICSPGKARGKLLGDLVVIGAVQLLALAYGVHTLYQARPAAMVFETHRMRVARQVDLDPKQLATLPEAMRPVWWQGPKLLSTRPPRADETVDAVLQAFSGRDLGLRPEFWVPADAVEQKRWAAAARPLAQHPAVLARPALADELAQDHLGRAAAGVKVLPVLARAPRWSVALDGETGRVLGFVPLD